MKKNNLEINFSPDFSKPRTEDLISPWQVTGLVDGEGSFAYSFTNKKNPVSDTVKSEVKLEFKVTQKSHSEGVLLELKKFFDCGNVVIDNRNTDTKKFQVTSLSDILIKIIPHFDKYPCLTSKYLNFRDWKDIALIKNKNEHLTEEGISKILKIVENLNSKRSFDDKFNFCMNTLNSQSISQKLTPQWLQGFLDGEATFYTYISKKKSRNTTYQGVDSSLEIAQNNHDVAVLIAIQKFFGSGYIKPKYDFTNLQECKNSRSVNRFVLRNTKIIINFLEEFPLITRKQLDYMDWKKIVELKKSNIHKTEEGLILIKQISQSMNSRRI